MSLEDRISQDLKAAMLAGQQQRVMTLRSLKSALLYEKVAKKLDRESAMSDEAVIALLAREAKKRQESADLYKQGNSVEKAEAELQEKAIIDEYLPKQMSEAEIGQLVDEAIQTLNVSDLSQMGQVIGAVKKRAGAAADGSLVARLVKERLST